MVFNAPFKYISVSFIGGENGGQVVIPTAHYSDSPQFPTAHCSDGPLFRQPITPISHFSDNPLFRQKWSKVVLLS
jgi:hypothetical protein